MKARIKIAALVFALMLAVVSLAGCGTGKEDDEKVTQTKENVSSKSEEKEKSAKDIAEEFLNNFFAADFDGAKKYVDPNSDSYSKLDSYKNNIKEEFISSSGIDDIGEKTDKGIDRLIDKMIATMSYKISDVEINEDSANISVTITTPSDLTGLLNLDVMDENKILDDYIESIGKTQEEFTNEASSYTDEQIKEFQDDFVAYMLNYITDGLKDNTDYETENNETTLSLKKVDGKWIIEEVGDQFFD